MTLSHPLRHRFLYLLIALMLYFIGNAFLQQTKIHYFVSMFFAILIIASLMTIANHKKILLIPMILLAFYVLMVTLSGGILHLPDVLKTIQMPLSVMFFLSITITALLATFKADKINTSTLYGAACTYIFIGLTFTYLFVCIHHFDPAAFKITAHISDAHLSHDFTYFSFVTLTTLGYGDIIPLSMVAKTACWMEAVIGQLYLTILIAQLIGHYITRKAHHDH